MPLDMLISIAVMTAGSALIGWAWGKMEIRQEREEEIKKEKVILALGIIVAAIGFIRFLSYAIFG